MEFGVPAREAKRARLALDGAGEQAHGSLLEKVSRMVAEFQPAGILGAGQGGAGSLWAPGAADQPVLQGGANERTQAVPGPAAAIERSVPRREDHHQEEDHPADCLPPNQRVGLGLVQVPSPADRSALLVGPRYPITQPDRSLMRLPGDGGSFAWALSRSLGLLPCAAPRATAAAAANAGPPVESPLPAVAAAMAERADAGLLPGGSAVAGFLETGQGLAGPPLIPGTFPLPGLASFMALQPVARSDRKAAVLESNVLAVLRERIRAHYAQVPHGVPPPGNDGRDSQHQPSSLGPAGRQLPLHDNQGQIWAPGDEDPGQFGASGPEAQPGPADHGVGEHAAEEKSPSPAPRGDRGGDEGKSLALPVVESVALRTSFPLWSTLGVPVKASRAAPVMCGGWPVLAPCSLDDPSTEQTSPRNGRRTRDIEGSGAGSEGDKEDLSGRMEGSGMWSEGQSDLMLLEREDRRQQKLMERERQRQMQPQEQKVPLLGSGEASTSLSAGSDAWEDGWAPPLGPMLPMGGSHPHASNVDFLQELRAASMTLVRSQTRQLLGATRFNRSPAALPPLPPVPQGGFGTGVQMLPGPEGNAVELSSTDGGPGATGHGEKDDGRAVVGGALESGRGDQFNALALIPRKRSLVLVEDEGECDSKALNGSGAQPLPHAEQVAPRVVGCHGRQMQDGKPPFKLFGMWIDKQ